MRRKRNRYRADKGKRRKKFLFGFKVVLGCTLTVSLVIVLSAAFARGYYALLEAPWLRLEEIQIVGLKHVDRKEILNCLGVPRHANILDLKMSQLAERLETLPMLRSAIVRLDPPGKMVVEVHEREPLAILHTGDFFLIDTEGKLYAKTDPVQASNLLVVTGLLGGAGLHEGDFLPPEVLEEINKLLASLAKVQGWFPLNMISECNWQGDQGFTLITAQKAVPIRLGLDRFDLKFERLQHILETLVERQLLDMVTRIDLDYANRAYIEGHFPAPKGI